LYIQGKSRDGPYEDCADGAQAVEKAPNVTDPLEQAIGLSIDDLQALVEKNGRRGKLVGTVWRFFCWPLCHHALK